eukprot:77444-Chlamydomonas_euryale.AAC.3
MPPARPLGGCGTPSSVTFSIKGDPSGAPTCACAASHPPPSAAAVTLAASHTSDTFPLRGACAHARVLVRDRPPHAVDTVSYP